jgi:hypothetical protein
VRSWARWRLPVRQGRHHVRRLGRGPVPGESRFSSGDHGMVGVCEARRQTLYWLAGGAPIEGRTGRFSS